LDKTLDSSTGHALLFQLLFLPAGFCDHFRCSLVWHKSPRGTGTEGIPGEANGASPSPAAPGQGPQGPPNNCWTQNMALLMGIQHFAREGFVLE